MRVDTVIVPDDGIDLVELQFGFDEDLDVPRALELLGDHGIDVDLATATYFLSYVHYVPSRARAGMARWRKGLFAALSRSSSSPDLYFRLPQDRVVSLGSNIEF